MLSGLSGGCRCGKVHYSVDAIDRVWGILICHCSMCPDKDKNYIDSILGPGVGFLAVPNYRVIKGSDLINTMRTSTFAHRTRCGVCDTGLTLSYDCELHTDWIVIDTLDKASKEYALTLPKQHLHCSTVPESGLGADGCMAFPGWEPWVPDPCRPVGYPIPNICNNCFQIRSTQNELNKCHCLPHVGDNFT
mmetsp:Transcript_15937/g.24009  ORF Transcript_15937/g.24009 Transcript_15937/m.24009 type:complete len:191 (-) Transcript_15937:73-645(-)